MDAEQNKPANGNGNGHAAESAVPQRYLLIEITDADSFSLKVSGTFPTHDYALNMLDQARRELEAQWRIQRMQQYKEQLVSAQQFAEVRADLHRAR